MTDDVWRPECPQGHDAKIVGATVIEPTTVSTWQNVIERPGHVDVQLECTTCEPVWTGRARRPLEE